MKILIGSAWVYANGSMHIGHLAGLLPADVIARYYRAKGDDVYFVSGSDCHGTPVTLRAKKENKTPLEISDYYHLEFCDCFDKLGFSFDCYGKTSSDEHISFVKEFHENMYCNKNNDLSQSIEHNQGIKNYPNKDTAAINNMAIPVFDESFHCNELQGRFNACGNEVRMVNDSEYRYSRYIYEKEAPQAFCEHCNVTLSDRFVLGQCPSCGKNSRGDQCDFCGEVLEPESLITPICSTCKNKLIFKTTKHLFISLSSLKDELISFMNKHPHWRKNAIAFTQRYIDEGLRDRAITRDIDWGIDVPKDGYKDKKIYIWAENVLGYLSMSKKAAFNKNETVCAGIETFKALWGENSRHYYVHGKDNIPFHTIILPALLLANSENWRLPDDIISSEYLTLEGRKISTSLNWAIWVKDIADRYNPDSIRYFLTTNGPEKRDTDFSWREFINSHNGELLGTYGNFVNRTLAFVYKYFNATIPNGKINEAISSKINALYKSVGSLIESGGLKEALDSIFEFTRFANKYFDSEKPWVTRSTDITNCECTIYNCIQIIANLSVLLEPFLPFSSSKIRRWLALDENIKWGIKNIPSGFIIDEPEILFERIDKKVIDEELNKLKL